MRELANASRQPARRTGRPGGGQGASRASAAEPAGRRSIRRANETTRAALSGRRTGGGSRLLANVALSPNNTRFVMKLADAQL